MKILKAGIVSLSLSLFSTVTIADTWLYDTSGAPSVYVDADTSTLYFPNGQPAGYVSNGVVYSYAGQQLGWYSDDILWDTSGYMVAYPQTRLPATVSIQSAPTTFVKQTPPTIVNTTPTVVTTPPPTFVYQPSPVPVNTYFTTTQPVQP